MSEGLSKVFSECAKNGRPAFVAYMMAGYQSAQETVPTMLALQEGGADIIELGVPFTDPIADGPTIQIANQMALQNKITAKDCFQFIRSARSAGVHVPIVLMGYYNPILNYGEVNYVKDASAAGANGFIVVDLPPEEAEAFREHCNHYKMSYIPLICPTTSDHRVRQISSLADTFIYCLSINGITGERAELPEHLSSFISRVRSITKLPLAVGFGISNRRHFELVGKVADGVVIGSAIVRALSSGPVDDQPTRARSFAESVTGRTSTVAV
jgi:tryptophan synthase